VTKRALFGLSLTTSTLGGGCTRTENRSVSSKASGSLAAILSSPCLAVPLKPERVKEVTCTGCPGTILTGVFPLSTSLPLSFSKKICTIFSLAGMPVLSSVARTVSSLPSDGL
jgi:hypothetical protein